MANLALTVTDVGNSKFADAINSGASIDINRIAFGSDGTHHTSESTALGAEIRKFFIESITKSGQIVTFHLTIPETFGGVNLREVGVLSVTGDLMAVGNMDLYKPNPSAGVGFAIEFEVNLVISDVNLVSDIVAGVVQGANSELAAVQAARDDAEEAKTASETARDQASASAFTAAAAQAATASDREVIEGVRNDLLNNVVGGVTLIGSIGALTVEESITEIEQNNFLNGLGLDVATVFTKI